MKQSAPMAIGGGAWTVGTPPEATAHFLKAAAFADDGEAMSPAADAGRLRKLASLRYLRRKVRGWFRPEHRDTIVCEEDEEALGGKRNIYDIIRWDDRSGVDLAKFVPPSPVRDAVAVAVAVPAAEQPADQPSRECRWCLNCSKSFQRRLSKFDHFCGLDCRTAHRFRQATCSQAPHHLCFYPSPQSPRLQQ
jgi:hypothetical protein